MKNLILVALICAAIAQPLQAEIGAGVAVSPMEAYPRSKAAEKGKHPDAVISEIAMRLNADDAELQKLWNRGYGRNEIITLLLIAERGRVTLKTVVKERDKGTRFSTLCARYGIDHRAVIVDANAVRQSINSSLPIAAITTSSDTEKQP